MKHLFLLFLMLSLPTGCTPALQGFAASKKSETNSQTKGGESNAEEEKVDIPNNIAGSYLTCSLRKDASETDVSSEYGCRLNEAGTNNRLDLSAFASRVQWKSNLSQGLSIEAYPQNSVWHALYRMTAADLPSLREAAARLQVQVQWEGALTFKDQKVIDVLQPADAAGDTTAPILESQGLDPTDPGTL